MSFDLGALVTRMTVLGQAEFERDINAGGAALGRAARQGDDFDLALGTMGSSASRFGAGVGLVGTELMGMGDKGRAALTQVGTGLTVAGVAIAAMLGLAVAKYAEYDAAISRSAAVTGAYGDELQAIRELTIQLGGDTVFTAREAAEGVTELGKAGLSTADILSGALAGSLNLAAAGEIAVADAAGITSAALAQFKLGGDQAAHVADLLAAGSGKALGGVSDLGAALNQSGLVASQMGLSIEEAAGSLAAFASAGLIGSDAGTSFRTMLLNLATPTTQQSALMKELKINAYDPMTGSFVGMTQLAGNLRESLGKLTAQERDHAMGVIFGSDSIRAANVLYNEGAEGIQGWIDATNDSGYASRIAAQNVDNLSGDLEKLGGAFDSALIKTGAGADGVLRELVQTVTSLVDGFSELPDWMQQVVLGGAALTAGFLLTAGAAMIAIPKMVEYRAALAVLRTEMPMTTAALGRVAAFLTGPWGVALAAATVGVTLLMSYMDSLKATSTEMTSAVTVSNRTLESLWATAEKGGGLVDVGNDLENIQEVATRLANGANPFSFFDSTKLAQTNATLGRIGETLGELAGTDMPSAVDAFQDLATQTDGTEDSLMGLLNSMPDFRQALIEAGTASGVYAENMTDAEKRQALLDLAMGRSADSSETAAQGYKSAADEAGALADSIVELIDLINEANGIGQDAVSANASYQESLAGITEEVNSQRAAYLEAQGTTDGFALSLDESTAAGSANAEMLSQVAADAQAAAAAQFDLDLATMSADEAAEKYLGTLGASREALVAQALANGFTAAEVQNLIDKVYALPSQEEVKIIAETTKATTDVENFISRFAGRTVSMRVTADTSEISGTGSGSVRAYGGIDHVRHMAYGGMSNAGAIAQVRRAGDLTVWAEHETGGESYIPWALDRRARSEEILSQTAKAFGGQYLPPGTKFAADGMIAGGNPEAVAGAPYVIKVYIGETELRVIAQETVDDRLTAVAVEYEGGTNL